MPSDPEPVKGVMIAERPGGLKAGELPAFVPACTHSPVGFSATKRVEVVRFRPVTVTEQHKQWIQEYQEAKRHEREKSAEDSQHEQAKREALAEFSTRLRAAVLSNEGVGFWKAHTGNVQQQQQQQQQQEQASGGRSTASTRRTEHQQAAEPAAPPPEQQQQDGPAAGPAEASPSTQEAQQRQKQEEAPSSSVPPKPPGTPSGQPAGRAQHARTPSLAARPASAAKSSSKPAWALSAGEAEALDAQEEDNLLSFVQDLDYDAFVASLDDPQLRESLQALEQEERKPGGADDQAWRRQFVRAMNHVSLKHAQRAARRKVEGDEGDDVSQRDEDGQSECRSTVSAAMRASEAAARRAALKEAAASDKQRGEQWDASSVGGTREQCQAHEAAQALAEVFLLENPDLRAVYSTAAARAVLTRTAETLSQA